MAHVTKSLNNLHFVLYNLIRHLQLLFIPSRASLESRRRRGGIQFKLESEGREKKDFSGFSILTCQQCDLKKSPNVYKNCPKLILLEK